MLLPEIFLPISLVSAGLFLPAYAGYYEMVKALSFICQTLIIS